MTRAPFFHAEGRTRGITVVTAVQPLRIGVTRFFFSLGRAYPPLMGFRDLRAIYFTRWSILVRPPYNGPPQPAERPQHPQLLWETDYTGQADPYIEAFVYRIPVQIRQTWGTSYGFPGTASIRRLRRYIQQTAVPIAYRYAAHPEATVREVLSALEVAREHDFLVDAARSSDAAEFQRVYRGYLQRRVREL